MTETRASRGFTLLELMVVVAMAAVLLAVASLNAPAFLGQQRLGRAARQVLADLRLARGKAIAQGTTFRVVFTAGSGAYVVERSDGAGGWTPHALYSKAATAAAPAPLLLPSPVAAMNGAVVQFRPRGSVALPVDVVLEDAGLAGASRTVAVSFAGQVAIR